MPGVRCNSYMGNNRSKRALVLANDLASQWAEEGAYILDQCLWLFQGCEVPSRFHLRPTLDIVEALGKGTWRNGKLIRENSYPCRNLNPPGICFITLVRGLVVEAGAGVECVVGPI